MTVTLFFLRGTMAHLLADWFFQNEWMAVNKVNPRHPAGYIHALLHVLCAWPAFGRWSLALGAAHWLIDLRFPLESWRSLYGQTTTGPAALHVAIWQDQAAHLIIIFILAVHLGIPL